MANCSARCLARDSPFEWVVLHGYTERVSLRVTQVARHETAIQYGHSRPIIEKINRHERLSGRAILERPDNHSLRLHSFVAFKVTTSTVIAIQPCTPKTQRNRGNTCPVPATFRPPPYSDALPRGRQPKIEFLQICLLKSRQAAFGNPQGREASR